MSGMDAELMCEGQTWEGADEDEKSSKKKKGKDVMKSVWHGTMVRQVVFNGSASIFIGEINSWTW